MLENGTNRELVLIVFYKKITELGTMVKVDTVLLDFCPNLAAALTCDTQRCSFTLNTTHKCDTQSWYIFYIKGSTTHCNCVSICIWHDSCICISHVFFVYIHGCIWHVTLKIGRVLHLRKYNSPQLICICIWHVVVFVLGRYLYLYIYVVIFDM